MSSSSFFDIVRLFIPYAFHSSKNRIRLGWTLVFLVVETFLIATIPLCGKYFIQSVEGTVQMGIFVALALWSLLRFFEKLVRPMQDLLFFPVINEAIRDITFRFVQHTHTISYLDYQKHAIPEVISSIKRISLSARFFFRTLCIDLLPLIIKLCVLIGSILWFPWYGIGVTAGLVSYSIIVFWGLSRYGRQRKEAWHASDKTTVTIHDSLYLTKVARFFPLHEEAEVRQQLEKEEETWLRTNRYMNQFQILVGLAMVLLLFSLSLLGIALVQSGRLSVGDFVLVQGQCVACLLPMKLLSFEIRQIQEAVVDMQKILLILSLPKEERDLPLRRYHTTSYALSLANMTFTYPHKAPLFSSTQATIQEGEKIHITGASGSGKSTLLLLLSGLLPPTQGSVLLYGQNLHTVTRESIQNTIHLLPQEQPLFTQSLRYNLLYGTSSLSQAAIDEAIAITELDEVIQRLPKGLDSSVGPLGMFLSGGERQRVILARSLLLKPRILLLDEAFHAISVEQEEKLLSVFLAKIPTLVLISHRTFVQQNLLTPWHIDRGRIVVAGREVRGESQLNLTT